MELLIRQECGGMDRELLGKHREQNLQPDAPTDEEVADAEDLESRRSFGRDVGRMLTAMGISYVNRMGR